MDGAATNNAGGGDGAQQQTHTNGSQTTQSGPPPIPPSRRPLRSLADPPSPKHAPSPASASQRPNAGTNQSQGQFQGMGNWGFAQPQSLASSSPAPAPPVAPQSPASNMQQTPRTQTAATNADPAVQAVLQSIFARFVHAAEAKVAALLYVHLDGDEDFSFRLRSGADAAFDRLLAAVGAIAKHCPRLLIDSIMVWRKYKSDNSLLAIPDDVRSQYASVRPKDLEALVRERKSLLSNFVLCRVLIEITSRLGRHTLSNELGERLEEMAFGQLRNADPDIVAKSTNRQANVDMFSEFIGILSNIRFATVSDRFISEIGKGGSLLKENKLELLIRSMRFLRIKIFPMDMLEETAEFLQTSADLFQNAHNIRIKHAYAEVFTELLDPIAAVATAEVNLPAWQRTVETIYPKAARMVAKPRHLHVALPLISTLLCVSRREFFLKNWGGFVEVLVQRFKDKGDKRLRGIALVSLSRLVWVYLFRHYESPASTVQRRIDLVLRILFPPNRRGIMPQECNLDAFVRLVYVILVKYPEYGIEAVTTGFLGVGPNTITTSTSALLAYATNTIDGDVIYNPSRASELIPNPERLIIALRSFLLLLLDMETSLGGSVGGSNGATAGTVSAVQSGAGVVFVEGKINIPVPTFPEHRASTTLALGSIDDLASMAQRDRSDGARRFIRTSANENELNKMASLAPLASENTMPIINNVLDESLLMRMGRSVRESLDHINVIIARALLILDQSIGNLLLADCNTAPFAAFAGSVSGTSGAANSTMSSLNIRRPSVNVGNESQMIYNSFYSNTSTPISASGVGSGSSMVINSPNVGMGAAVGNQGASIANSFASNTAGAHPLNSSDRDRAVFAEAFSKERHQFDLLRVILDSLPRYSPTDVPPTKVISILSRLMLHLDDNIRQSAFNALCRIARISESTPFPSTFSTPHIGQKSQQPSYWSLPDSESMVAAVVRIASETCASIVTHRIQDIITSQGNLDHLIVDLFENYLVFANIWFDNLDAHVSSAMTSDDPQSVLNWLNHSECMWITEEIESKGMLFLVTTSPVFRQAGIKALWFADELDGKMEVMREQALAALKSKVPLKPTVSEHEMVDGDNMNSSGISKNKNSTLQRLSKLHGATRSNSILRRQSARSMLQPNSKPVNAQTKITTHHRRQLSQHKQDVPVRIIRIMLDCGQELLRKHYFDRVLVTSNRSAMHKLSQTKFHRQQQNNSQQHQTFSSLLSNQDCLMMIAVSSDTQDKFIWERCLPDLFCWIVDCGYPRVVQLCLNDLIERVRFMYASVYALSETGATIGAGLSRAASASVSAIGGVNNTVSANNAASGGASSAASVVNKWVNERSLSSSSASVLLLEKRQTSMNNVSGSHVSMNHQNVSASNSAAGSGPNSINNANMGGINSLGSGAGNSNGASSGGGSLPQDTFISHWKLCLMFVATALPASSGSPLSMMCPRRGSSQTERDPTLVPLSIAPSIRSIDDLLNILLPLFTSENVSIRQSVAIALGSVHPQNHRPLLMAMQPYLRVIIADMQMSYRPDNQSPLYNTHNSYSSLASQQLPLMPRDASRKTSVGQLPVATTAQAKRLERLRMELTYALSLTANFVHNATLRQDTTIMSPVLDYVSAVMQFLSQSSVQFEWDHQMLRFYFCSLVDRLYSALCLATQSHNTDAMEVTENSTNASAGVDRDTMDSYIPFSLRHELFELFEGWCGYGVHGDATRDREARMMMSVLDHIKDTPQRPAVTSTMEEQRRALEVASIKAMASLCNGPTQKTETKSSSLYQSNIQFDIPKLVAWINSILSSPQSQYHPIARKAIEYVLAHNAGNEQLMEEFLKQCYVPVCASSSNTSNGIEASGNLSNSGSGATASFVDSKVSLAYFLAIVDLVSQLGADMPIPVSKILCLALCQISSESPQKRRGAARLLLAVDRKVFGRGVEASRIAADVQQLFDYGKNRLDVPDAQNPSQVPEQPQSGHESIDRVGIDPSHQNANGLSSCEDVFADDGSPIITEEDVLREVQATYETAAITSSLPTVYRCAQAVVSQRLAQERPELTYKMLSELVYRVHLLEPHPQHRSQIRNLLMTIIPWLRNVDLNGSFSLDSASNADPNQRQSISSTDDSTRNVSNVDQAFAAMVLTNLLYLTAKFGGMFVTEIETIWHQLVDTSALPSESIVSTKNANPDASIAHALKHGMSRQQWEEKRVGLIIDFLILFGLERRNPRFIPIAKQIAVCICRTSSSSSLIDTCMSKLTPRGMVPSSDSLNLVVKQRLARMDGLYTVNLDDILLPMHDRNAFSAGQVSFMLIVDVSIEIGSFALRPYLPMLLNVIFVQLDHFVPVISEQSRSLFVNMIQAMVTRESGNRERMDAMLTVLNMKEGKLLWSYEDVSPDECVRRLVETCMCRGVDAKNASTAFPNESEKTDASPFHLQSADQMSALALETIDLFTPIHPTLRQTWGELALTWGTQCPVRHIACRSLQLFRTLSPVYTQRMLGDLLARMSAMLGDAGVDVQGYTYELLTTMHAMMRWITLSPTPTRLITHFPQFFWASVSCLYSPNEWEFESGMAMIKSIMDVVDITDEINASRIMVTMPTRWRGDFGGVIPLLVLPGMCSSRLEKPVLDLVTRIMMAVTENDVGKKGLACAQIVDVSQTSRVLYTVFANLPRMLEAFDVDAGVRMGRGVSASTVAVVSVGGGKKEFGGGSRDDVYGTDVYATAVNDDADYARAFVRGPPRTPIRKGSANQINFSEPFKMNVDCTKSCACFVHASFAVSVDECRLIAQRLSKSCEKLGHASLSRILDSYSRNKFRTKDDFLREFATVIRQLFFPKWESRLLQFLVSLLSNCVVFYRKKVLMVLRVLFSDGSSSGDERGFRIGAAAAMMAGGNSVDSVSGQNDNVDFVQEGSTTTSSHLGRLTQSWIQPLLGLLETDLCAEATQVLDEVIAGRIPMDENDQRIVFGDKTIYRVAKEAMLGGSSFSSSVGALSDAAPPTKTNADLSALTGWRVKDAAKSAAAARYNMSGASMTCAGGFDVFSRADVPVVAQEDVGKILETISVSVAENDFEHMDVREMDEDALNALLDEMNAYFDEQSKMVMSDSILEEESQKEQQEFPHELSKEISKEQSMLTPAKRLLMKAGSRVLLTLRLLRAHEAVVADAEFAHWLKSDLADCLRLRAETVHLVRIKEDAAATLVTVAIGSGLASAAHAEELVAILSQESAERSMLLRGVVLHCVDLHFAPEMAIEFVGMVVPYAAEGIRI